MELKFPTKGPNESKYAGNGGSARIQEYWEVSESPDSKGNILRGNSFSLHSAEDSS